MNIYNQGVVNKQQLNFNKQLTGGVKGGSINKDEFMRLSTYDQQTREMEGKYLKDGTLSFQERQELEKRNKYNQNLMNLYTRGDFHPEQSAPKNGIETRMQNQLSRTYNGLSDGSMTYGEGVNSLNRQGDVATNYGKFKATPNSFWNRIHGRGEFSSGERSSIHRQLDRNSRQINDFRHNWASDWGSPENIQRFTGPRFDPPVYQPPANFPRYPAPSMGGGNYNMPQFPGGGCPSYMSPMTQQMFAMQQMQQMMMMFGFGMSPQMCGMDNGMGMGMGMGMPMGMSPFMQACPYFPLSMTPPGMMENQYPMAPPSHPYGPVTPGTRPGGEGHVGTPWISQFDGRYVPGAGSQACFRASKVMTEMAGGDVLPVGQRIQIGRGEDSNGRLAVDSNAARRGLERIDSQLSNHKPVTVGVSYKDANYNADGLTDHFVVITGKGQDENGKTYYTFNDPGTTNRELGSDKNSKNRFYIDEKTGKLYRPGNGRPGMINKNYEVSMVR